MAGDEGRTVGDYVTLTRGTTYKGSLVGHPGPALLGLGSIEPGGGFRHGDFKTYGGDCPPGLMLAPGDLYAALKGATKDGKMIGSVARVPISVPSGRLTQDTVKLVFRKANEDEAKFLYWILRTPQYRSYCAGRAMGSAVVALSRTDFLSYPVPELTLERRHLVALFESIDDRITLLSDTNRTLEDMARLLFRAWFVNFEPVRAKMEGRAPTSCDAATAALFPDRLVESELGNVPEGWAVASLGEHLEVTKGLSYKGEGLADSGTPLHNLNSVYEGGGYKHEGLKWYRGDFKERHVCKPGDIIVANTEQGHEYRLIGFPALLPKRYGTGIFTHHIFRVVTRAGSYLPHSFIYRLLLHPACREQVIGHTNGTTVNSLAREGLERPRFVLPPENLVAPFNRVVSTITQRQEEGLDRIESLTSLRDELLPRLMSGGLTAPEAA